LHGRSQTELYKVDGELFAARHKMHPFVISFIQDQKNNPEPLEYAAYFKDTALSFRF